jgi:hypothetical protein
MGAPRFDQCASRETDRHAALQTEKSGAQGRQPYIGIRVDDATGIDRHIGDRHRRRIARAQRHEIEIGGPDEALVIMRQRGNECAPPALLGHCGGNIEALWPQIGDPGKPAFKNEAVRSRTRAHVQFLDAGKELHCIGETRGTGHATGK